MHSNVSSVQNQHKEPNVDQLALSQRDMVLTQASRLDSLAD